MNNLEKDSGSAGSDNLTDKTTKTDHTNIYIVWGTLMICAAIYNSNGYFEMALVSCIGAFAMIILSFLTK